MARLIDFSYLSPIQDESFKKSASEYNKALQQLQVARIEESILQLEKLMKYAGEEENKRSDLYYPIVDRCSIAVDHLRDLLDYIKINHI